MINVNSEMLNVGDKILYMVDGVVGETECEVLEIIGNHRYKIRDGYGYTYLRYIFNPILIK